MELRSWVKAGFGRASRHSVFLGFELILTGFIFYPIAQILERGRVFGPDVTEYLFTAHEYLTGAHSAFSYPFPLLPALFVPVVAVFPTLTAS